MRGVRQYAKCQLRQEGIDYKVDRTQPGLPLKRGRAGTMTHDHKRHGTITLFAAMKALPAEDRLH